MSREDTPPVDWWWGGTENALETVLESLSLLVSGKLGIRLKSGMAWSYDAKNHTLTYDRTSLYALSDDVITGLILHEAGHARFSPQNIINVETFPEKYGVVAAGYPIQATWLINSLENVRMERLVAKLYPRAHEFLREAYDEATQYYRINRQIETCEAKSGPKSYPVSLAVDNLRHADIPLALPKYAADFLRDNKQLIEEYASTTNIELLPPIIKAILNKYAPYCQDEARKDFPRAVTIPVPDFRIMANTKSRRPEPLPDAVSYYQNIVKNDARQLAEILRRIKQRKMAGGWEPRKRSGARLDKKRLYQLKLGNPKLFLRRTAPHYTPPSFLLIHDDSGSMYYGSNDITTTAAHEALEITTMFIDALRLAGIPHAAIAYAEIAKTIKDFNAPLGDTYRFVKEDMGRDRNNEAEAGKAAKKLIREAGAKTPFVVLLTDGQTPMLRAASLIQSIKDAGGELLAIGFRSSDKNLPKTYPNFREGKTFSEVKAILLPYTRRIMRGSK